MSQIVPRYAKKSQAIIYSPIVAFKVLFLRNCSERKSFYISYIFCINRKMLFTLCGNRSEGNRKKPEEKRKIVNIRIFIVKMFRCEAICINVTFNVLWEYCLISVVQANYDLRSKGKHSVMRLFSDRNFGSIKYLLQDKPYQVSTQNFNSILIILLIMLFNWLVCRVVITVI